MVMHCQSKLAVILYSLELQIRSEAAVNGVTSIAVQAGCNKTSLARHPDEEAYAAAVQRVGGLMKPWQGALPSLYAAAMKDARDGELYEANEGGYSGCPTKAAITPQALDEVLSKKLWELAEEAVEFGFRRQ